ncbi:unnamed protein product [Didymodactylos carnosus]|uniref:Uncharacterized protein n=1 Tax=Didymodactylos carnosus TaxID=1234261 RepID=A0A815CQE3_9BILA|nr:unnamed protein product [Didymodactylos carnosus]CAF1290401.1 unnamed protein product [Didymodactylos carnosus]CAF3835157.1 unnamed protein product [Didymodactylos carnosus]CAF4095827.1 unnamed protein product [Didymodactylos carnosus]
MPCGARGAPWLRAGGAQSKKEPSRSLCLPYFPSFQTLFTNLSIPMIEINDLSSDESPDVILSTATGHSSADAGGSLPECSIGDIKYDTSNIKVFLKNQSGKYTLVGNPRVNTVKPSACWTRFALPAVKDENHRNIIIKKFA